ncbi:MAG: hypothetical protein ACXAC7_07150 [Candidatus Hodarchaeales archaeon]
MNLNKISGKLIFILFTFGVFISGQSISQEDGFAFEAGDTIFYDVTKWKLPNVLDFPLDNSTDISTNFNLNGSIIALKILDTNNQGFILGAYAKIEKLGSVSIASEGLSLLTLPLPKNFSIPFLAENEFFFEPWKLNRFSIPIWIKDIPWLELNSWIERNDNLTINLTETDLTLNIKISELGEDGLLTLNWLRSENDVFFKVLSLKGTIPFNNQSEDIEIMLKQNKIEKRSLASELDVGDKLVYEVVKSDATINLILNELAELIINPLIEVQSNGLYDDYQDILNDIKENITALKNEILYEYEITDISGVFYNTSISQYNFTEKSLSHIGERRINGFFGSPSSVINSANLSSDIELLGLNVDNQFQLTLNQFIGSLGIGTGLPIALTPDWDMWIGIVNQTATLEALSSLVPIDQINDNLEQYYNNLGFNTEPGVKFSSLWKDEGDIQYSGSKIQLDFSWDSSSINPETLNLDEITDYFSLKIPKFNFKGQQFTSYSKEGILIGYGVNYQTEITFNATIDPTAFLDVETSEVNLFNIDVPIEGDLFISIDQEIRLSDKSEGVPRAVEIANNLDSKDFLSSLPLIELAVGFGILGTITTIILVPRYLNKP